MTLGTPCLGIDFGGVIVPLLDGTRGRDTQFAERFLSTVPNPGAFQAIASLAQAFGGRVWIVSKAGERTEAITRQWLRAHAFFNETGVDGIHLRFCRERIQKRVVCEELGVSHFVDDRVHVMQILRGTVPHLYHFGAPAAGRTACPWATPVADWAEAHAAILRDMPEPP